MTNSIKRLCALILSLGLIAGTFALPACSAGEAVSPPDGVVDELPEEEQGEVTDDGQDGTEEDEEEEEVAPPSAPGGNSDGGTSNGGTSNGGTSNGGTSNGGSSNGGTSNGGNSNGGTTTPPAQTDKIGYIAVIGANVNVRSGAGTGYSVLGQAKQSTLFAIVGKVGNWYITYYKNTLGYIYSDYCQSVYMTASTDKRVENVISDATKLLGVKYVYGAVRYHDGNGNRLSGFSVYAFDCSSLLQYAFKTGANYNLQVNTRTQVKQGKTVAASQLKRGDLMFFTNASRYNNTGVERIGHVALYLGDNYILHTSSEFAKIEKLTTSRWNYYVQSQRIF